jgi:zona occludens toxin (predicted ATPase)
VGSGTGAHVRRDAPTSDDAAARAPGSRVAVALLALLALVLVSAFVYLVGTGATSVGGDSTGDTGPTPVQGGAEGPAAVLEDALACGTPAYVLIHSES